MVKIRDSELDDVLVVLELGLKLDHGSVMFSPLATMSNAFKVCKSIIELLSFISVALSLSCSWRITQQLYQSFPSCTVCVRQVCLHEQEHGPYH